MKKYREKPRIVQAQQWHKDGDHHRVEVVPAPFDPRLVVKLCKMCGKGFTEHGTMKFIEDKSMSVCPGDYIIKDSFGRYSVMCRQEFEDRYEEIKE